MATKTASPAQGQQKSSSRNRENVWVTPDDKKRDTYVTRTERPADSGQTSGNAPYRF